MYFDKLKQRVTVAYIKQLYKNTLEINNNL